MNFQLLINSINQTHQHFQQKASRAVNVSLTLRNWLIGYYIVEFEQNGDERAQYGNKLLLRLAESCSHIKGIDERTLRNFRLFYQCYPQFNTIADNELKALPIRRSVTSELQSIDIQTNEANIYHSSETNSELNNLN